MSYVYVSAIANNKTEVYLEEYLHIIKTILSKQCGCLIIYVSTKITDATAKKLGLTADTFYICRPETQEDRWITETKGDIPLIKTPFLFKFIPSIMEIVVKNKEEFAINNMIIKTAEFIEKRNIKLGNVHSLKVRNPTCKEEPIPNFNKLKIAKREIHTYYSKLAKAIQSALRSPCSQPLAAFIKAEEMLLIKEQITKKLETTTIGTEPYFYLINDKEIIEQDYVNTIWIAENYQAFLNL